jgi:hypothetical protein
VSAACGPERERAGGQEHRGDDQPEHAPPSSLLQPPRATLGADAIESLARHGNHALNSATRLRTTRQNVLQTCSF